MLGFLLVSDEDLIMDPTDVEKLVVGSAESLTAALSALEPVPDWDHRGDPVRRCGRPSSRAWA